MTSVVRHSSTDNHDIAFDTVQFSNSRKLTPTREAVFREQAETRLIVGEDEAHQCIHPERRRLGNGPLQQIGAQASPPERLMDVDAQFRGFVVRRTAVERRKTQPRGNLAFASMTQRGRKAGVCVSNQR